MKNLWYSFIGACKLFVWAFRYPQILNDNNFRSLSQLFELILKVAIDDKPYMSKLAQVVAGDQHNIVSIWAGPGCNADPTDRISELLKDNEKLRSEVFVLTEQLSKAISVKSVSQP
jgi:hypothetical protein